MGSVGLDSDMLGFFESLFKLLKFEKIQTDNFVFRLHYKFTFPVLVLFSLMLTSTQYFGSPIDCISTGVDKGIVNTYCWTHGTYTVQNLEGVTNRPPSTLRRRTSLWTTRPWRGNKSYWPYN